VSDPLVNFSLATLLAICVVCFVIALAGMISAGRAFAQADRADAQADFTDPVDADDTLPDWIRRLRDDMTACEADGFIDEIYAFLKEQAK
jgi:hypothetical protein